MRCYACDCDLSDYESTRKSKITGQYLDLCDSCYYPIQDIVILAEEQQEEKELKNDNYL